MRDDRNKCGREENGPAILSRRSLLELAGIAVATAALPPRAVMAKACPSTDSTEQGVSPVTDKLSTYMSEASARELPDEVTDKTKQHILDTVAAMISGSQLAPGRAALQFAGAYGGKGSGLENCMWPDRGGTDEWGVGSRRRNRRFARPVAVASRLRGSACCPCGGGTVRYQRDTLPARSDAWLRHRTTVHNDPGWAAV